MLFRRILVPVDFSDRTVPALELALALAREAPDAAVTVCHVAAAYDPDTTRRLQELLAAVAHRDVRLDVVVADGDPATEILELAHAGGFDVIVVGTRRRTGVADYLLGSVAMRVIAAARCPVITVAPDLPALRPGEAPLQEGRS